MARIFRPHNMNSEYESYFVARRSIAVYNKILLSVSQ